MGFWQIPGDLAPDRHSFLVSFKSSWLAQCNVLLPGTCYIEFYDFFNPCFLLVSHRVFSIYYPKSIQGRGSTLGFWGINFFPDTFMHWVTLFEDKPPIHWGLWACTYWWKNVVQFGLRSVQFLSLEILLLAWLFVPLQCYFFSLPLLKTVKQGGYDKTLSAGSVRVKTWMSCGSFGFT